VEKISGPCISDQSIGQGHRLKAVVGFIERTGTYRQKETPQDRAVGSDQMAQKPHLCSKSNLMEGKIWVGFAGGARVIERCD
jgi:hypothetical protein